MKRRRLLAALGPGLTGCIGTSRSPSTAGTDPGGSEQDTDLVASEFSVSTEKTAPDHRYFVRITKVYSSDAVERHADDPTVVDVSEVEDADVRAVLEDVLSQGKLRRDAIPDGLRETVERVDFFTWNATTQPDDTASHWGVEVYRPDRDPVVEFDAALVDDTISATDPGAIEFSLENTGDRAREVFSGTVPPFGVLWAGTVEGSDGSTHEADDDRYLLWRDYEDEGCVNFGDDGRMIVCDIGKITSIAPGETVSKTYQLRPENPVGSALAPGEYVVSDTLSYHRESQGPTTKVEWEVRFTVEEA
jgi:hypothetical protein